MIGPDPAALPAPGRAGSGPYCTADDVRDALRLAGAPTFDQDRINRATVAAGEAIDAWLDRPVELPLPTPPPQTVVQANITLAVLEYLTPGAAAAALATPPPGPDVPLGVPNITPWKLRWGLG